MESEAMIVSKDREKAKEDVFRLVKEHNIKFTRLWFTDILGFLKTFSITIEELERALEEGMGFDGSSIQGFTRIDESDMVALPDPTTFTMLPWRPRDHATAKMFCDVTWPGGEPFEGDPRYVLRRNLAEAAKLGYTFNVGPELEYFYFKNAEGTQALDQGNYFDLTPPEIASDLRRESVLILKEMGIPVEYSHHEAAPSQHEIDLKFTDAMSMADNVMVYRIVVKQVAQKYGFYATFMPKPVVGINGSGMHVHMSLFSGDRNAFFNKDDPYHFSKVGKQFLAGLLKHAPEITLVTNQWINSYKRLVPGYEAPVYITWARRNRSHLIRIPEYKPGKENATRLELRSPDPACNPYLVFCVLLAAGLEGIKKGYEIPDPLERNVYEMTPEEKSSMGVHTLPGSLAEAIQLTEKSELVRRTLGDHIFHTLLRNKRMEWDEYRTQVTDWELKKYLPIL